MKKPSFILTLCVERLRNNSTTEIVDSVSLGEFENESEAREALEEILENAGLVEETEDADD